jgi:hypothetical protein
LPSVSAANDAGDHRALEERAALIDVGIDGAVRRRAERRKAPVTMG